MGWIQNQKIGNRLQYGFGILVVMVLLLGVLAMIEMNTLANFTRDMHQHPLKLSNVVREIRSEVITIQRSMKDLLLAVNAEHIQETLDEIGRSEKTVESLFQILSEQYLGDSDDIQAVRQEFTDWKPINRQAIELLRKGQIDAATELVRGRGVSYVDAIQARILPISNFAASKAESLYRDSMRSKKIHLWIMSGLIILIAAAGIVTGTVITRSISDPLGHIIGEMGKITGGNLGHKIRMDRRDEVGQLAQAFNEMTENLEKTTASRDELNAANQQLQANEQQLRAANQQLQANEQQLRAANQQLKSGAAELSFRNAELQSIVYTVSHDLKAPLVNIKGFSEELEGYSVRLIKHLRLADLPPTMRKEVMPLLEEEIPRSLQFILVSTGKMKSLLDGFLRVSKIRSAPIQKETLDMNALMASVLATMHYQIESGGVSVTVDDLPPCIGDSDQINQVFSNLVDNALKYLDPVRPGTIRIAGRKDGDWITYQVSDNGIGIDSRHQDKVFEMFHRLDPNSTVPGDGLGLTIVSRILDRHQGRIRLESEPGKGTTFYVLLPTTAMTPKRDDGCSGGKE